jgi:hypothetical protein
MTVIASARRTRPPTTSAGQQQLSRRAEGPAPRDIGPWRTLPRHGGLTMARGPEADAEQRDQTRAPRNRDPREAEAGPLAGSCPGSARAPAAGVNDGPVTMYPADPAGMQDSRTWGASAFSRQRAGSCAGRTDTRAAMTAEPALWGECNVWGAADRRPLPARKLADNSAQFAQTCQDSASGIVDACGPKSPGSHRVVWGLTSRPPVPPAGFPPASRLPAGYFPFLRLPPVSRRPAFSGSVPSAVARSRFPFGFPPASLSLERSSR